MSESSQIIDGFINDIQSRQHLPGHNDSLTGKIDHPDDIGSDQRKPEIALHELQQLMMGVSTYTEENPGFIEVEDFDRYVTAMREYATRHDITVERFNLWLQERGVSRAIQNIRSRLRKKD